MFNDDKLATYATVHTAPSAHLPAPRTDEEQAHFLCACYGVLCLDYALAMGRITAQEHFDVRARVAEGAYVPKDLVRKAFPRPFSELARHGMPVTGKTMSDYWHRHAGPSPVLPCIVECRLRPNGTVWRVRFEASHTGLFPAECPIHTLHIENGDRMWAHVAYDTRGNIRKIIIPEHRA